MAKTRNISKYRQRRVQSSSRLLRFFSSPQTFAIIALIFLLLILVPLAKSYSRKHLVEKEIAGIQQGINAFEAKNKDLKEMIDYLQSDQSLEEQARLNMGLKRPGETVAVIEGEVVDLGLSSPALIDQSPNWQKWWRYFAK